MQKKEINYSEYELKSKGRWLQDLKFLDNNFKGTFSGFRNEMKAQDNQSDFHKFFHDMINENVLIEIPEKEKNVKGLSSKYYKINWQGYDKFKLKLKFFNKDIIAINDEHKNNNALDNDIDVWDLDMKGLEEKYGHS